MDLCIDARMAFCSGIGTYIREIVPYFLNTSFNVILLVDQVGKTWCKDFEQIAFTAPIYSVREQLLYPIKIPRSDLFWSPHYNVPLLPIRARKRVATIHDACHLVMGSRAVKLYAKWVMRKALRKSNRVITVSQFSKKEIENLLETGNIEVIPIGVNLDRFSPQKSEEAIRQKYQLPEPFVLFVGNHKPHKNVDGLVRAFSRIKQLKLVLVGKGQPFGEVDSEDLPALYSMAKAFVFPSFYEGFGLPPLEAMACGCPTAVSKAASMPEVCGDASIYFDPFNEQEMADAILKTLEHREPLIAKGLERVREFNWKTTAERHMRLFEEVTRA